MLGWSRSRLITSITIFMLSTRLIYHTAASTCHTLETTSAVIVNCSKMEDNCDLSDVDSRVTVLDCSFNSLREISGISATPKLINLVALNFSHNRIENMDNFIAQDNLGNLRELDLSFNRLSEIPKGIQRVNNLKLENNLIKMLIVDNLADWKALRFLSLRNNFIESVVCDDKTLTMNLQQLDLGSNKIFKINSCTFAQLRKLRFLDLSNNSILEIEKDSFKGMDGLIHLDLSSNKIHSVPSQLFEPLMNLKYLNLSDNTLVMIPDILPMTDWFDISFNRITLVPETQSHVLYPQTVFLIGGNPFDCTCDLLWLKELYDTREYLLKYHTNIDTERFIPVCQTPEEISGESWDNLGDVVFHCASLDKENLKLANDQIEHVLNKEKRLTATEIGQNFVDLKWYVSSSDDITSFELSYRVFGKSAVKNVVLPVTVTSYRLKKLESNTPYVICLIPESDTSRQNCVEIVTESGIQANGFTIEYVVRFVYSYRTVIALTVGVLSFTYAWLHWSE